MRREKFENVVKRLTGENEELLEQMFPETNLDKSYGDILKEFYKDEEFVRICDEPVTIKNTSGTNFCDIFVAQNGRDLFINSSIDNLLKGASSAAVVNANLMCGLAENCGIPKIAYVP